jgi:hypothetical protein
MRSTFRALSDEGCSQDTFLAVLRTAAGGLRALSDAGGPEEPLRAVLQMVRTCFVESPGIERNLVRNRSC